MRARCSYEYAVIRVVPRVDREEFVNAGVILYCLERDYLAAEIALDRDRLRALYPGVDLAQVEEHLRAIPAIAAATEGSGPIGRLSARERFRWLVAPRSTAVQTSPVHAGLCDDPQAALEHLLDRMVRPEKPPAGGASGP